MSATAPNPEPTGLSDAQRRVLDDLAAHENAADPGYVLRMNAPVRAGGVGPGVARAGPVAEAVARGRRRDRLVQVVVIAAIVALVLPLAWTFALVLVLALVAGPTYLAVAAWREGRSGAAGERPDPPADPGPR